MLDMVKNAEADWRTIRVYCDDPFVANSYFGDARTRYFQAERKDGKWIIFADNCSAKRSYGTASQTTVNGRAY